MIFTGSAIVRYTEFNPSPPHQLISCYLNTSD